MAAVSLPASARTSPAESDTGADGGCVISVIPVTSG